MRSTKRASATADRRAERQRGILDAAVRAFSRYGYHGCTVSRVAREAGVADGTLYLYFGGKEDLLVSAFRHALEGMLRHLDQVVATAPDPVSKLERALGLHLEFLEADRDLAMFLQFQLRQPDESIRKAIAVPLSDYARRLEAIFDEGKACGTFRADLSSRVLRRVFFGAVDETVTTWLLRPEGARLRDKLAPLLDVLLHGALRR